MIRGNSNPKRSIKEFKPFALIGQGYRDQLLRSINLSPDKKQQTKSCVLLPKVQLHKPLAKNQVKIGLVSSKMQNSIINKYHLKLRMNQSKVN
jgi:hypothetical protein